MSDARYLPPPELGRIGRRALIVGIASLALCGVGAIFDPAQFLRAYLMAYLFWIGVCLGCLAIFMMQFLTGGVWALVIRRLLEAGSRTIWLMAPLFLPILLGMHQLYSWSNPGVVEKSDALKHKQLYLNLPFFYARAAFYFAVWIGLNYLLDRWSRRQDEADDPRTLGKLQLMSGPGLMLYGLTVTFAGIDWVMSLEPEWFSTIYGMLIMAGQGLAALSVVIAVAGWLSKRAPLEGVILPRHFHDLGKLLLAFVMIWAYFGFSQLLIIWAGNLPDEIPWYLRRLKTEWAWVGLLLVVFQFAFPFILLLSRNLKRNANAIVAVALVVIAMRFVDLFWLTAPEFDRQTVRVSWMDFVAPIGIGGLWLAFFVSQLKGRPLVPLHDPYVEMALAGEAEG